MRRQGGGRSVKIYGGRFDRKYTILIQHYAYSREFSLLMKYVVLRNSTRAVPEYNQS